MARRMYFATLAVLLFLLSGSHPVLPEESPAFQLGFKLLADQIPDLVGEPLEDEHHNPLNGDGLQMTTAGLMVWRKADNWTAFTDGWRTWVNGPEGLQERGNDERFPWEARADPPEEPPAPVDAPTPSTSDAVFSVGPGPTAASGPLTPPPPAGGPPHPAPATETPFAATPGPPTPAAPTSAPSSSPTPWVTVPPAPTATAAPATATRTPAPSATATRTPVATSTPIVGGAVSADPAGEWVTSTYSTTRYYTSRDDASRWRDWAPENRIWFATEGALLAAFPARTRAVTNAAATAGPSATPAPTSQPTSVVGGVPSSDPAGEWVTSVASTTKYYTTRASESVWKDWSAKNRIWFATEAALLAAYPGRTRK